jgi:hypothetical protein
MRGKMLLVIPDLGQDRDIDLGQAAEDIDSPDMLFRRLTPSARARLESLGGVWFQTSATIAYRTADHDPGEATSPISASDRWPGEPSIVRPPCGCACERV